MKKFGRFGRTAAAAAALALAGALAAGFIGLQGTARTDGGCIGYVDYGKKSGPLSYRGGETLTLHGMNKGTLESSDWLQVSREGQAKRWLHKRCFASVEIGGERIRFGSEIPGVGGLQEAFEAVQSAVTGEEAPKAAVETAAPEAPKAAAPAAAVGGAAATTVGAAGAAAEAAAPVPAPAPAPAPAASAPPAAAAAFVPAGDGERCMEADAFPKRLRRSPEDKKFLEICSILDRSDDASPKEELAQTADLIRAHLGSIFHERGIQFVLHGRTAPGKSSKEIVEDVLDVLAPHATWKDLRQSAYRHVLCGDFRRAKDGTWTMEGEANSGLHARLRYEALLDEGAICQTKDLGRPFGGEVAAVSYRIAPKGAQKLAGAIDVDDSVADHVATLLEFDRTVCELSEGGQCRRALVKKEISGEDYPYTVWCRKYSDGRQRIYTAYPRECPEE